MKQPDKRGHFGKFGGKFILETLMAALEELEESAQALAYAGKIAPSRSKL